MAVPPTPYTPSFEWPNALLYGGCAVYMYPWFCHVQGHMSQHSWKGKGLCLQLHCQCHVQGHMSQDMWNKSGNTVNGEEKVMCVLMWLYM